MAGLVCVEEAVAFEELSVAVELIDEEWALPLAIGTDNLDAPVPTDPCAE